MEVKYKILRFKRVNYVIKPDTNINKFNLDIKKSINITHTWVHAFSYLIWKFKVLKKRA